jgi:hypothetical protein
MEVVRCQIVIAFESNMNVYFILITSTVATTSTFAAGPQSSSSPQLIRLRGVLEVVTSE